MPASSPTTGKRMGQAVIENPIQRDATDEIACWFIDTHYDGERFFVGRASFTGADEPYEKLKRALRAEIDESAWSALYSTKSQPFRSRHLQNCRLSRLRRHQRSLPFCELKRQLTV